jgi:hypothetical protein
MKYIYFYISVFFIKIIELVDSFKPFIEKYMPTKTRDIVKTLSGLLQNIPYIKSYNSFSNYKFLGSSTEQVCDLQTEICKEISVPGYMEHDPKTAALRKYKEL